MPKIFISYGWEDKAITQKLVDHLKRDGVEVWIDYSGIRAGDNLPNRISDALEWCDTLILLWSKSAGNSRWVKLEWTNSVALEKRIIPCLIDNTRLPSLLAHFTYIDLTNFEKGYSALAKVLNLLGERRQSKDTLHINSPESQISDEVIKSRTKVFISYSHKNSVWLERLRAHLKPLELNNDIEVWDDRKIKAGSKWRKEIERAVQSARIAVLLISADFLASDFIQKNELPPLLAAANEGGAIILPIIVSPCRFLRTASLSQYQAVNDPSRPVIAMNEYEQEKLFDEVAETIETALDF